MCKNNIEIVVSRYNENLSWLNEYPFNQFEYIVYNAGTTSMRAGTILCVWNSTGASYTDTSTTDLGTSTTGISFTVTSSGGIVTLNALITSGTWNIKVGTRVIF